MADCGCDFAGTGGEMCPEALVLAKACEETYRRWLQLRRAGYVNEAIEEAAAYDAAVQAYRAHVEAT